MSTTLHNRVIDEEVARAENNAFEAKCAAMKSRGQQLLAMIRRNSKYFSQTPAGVFFPVVVTPGNGYCVQGGPGGQYRLSDVFLFVIFDASAEPIQITFSTGARSTRSNEVAA